MQNSNRKHKPAKSIQSLRRTKRRINLVEQLEERSLLTSQGVFAELSGEISPNESHRTFTIQLYNQDFQLAGGQTLLGFHVHAETGSPLNPAAVRILDVNGGAIAPKYIRQDLSTDSSSVVLASLAIGTYQVEVVSQNESSGKFVVDVSLPGDLDGNGRVSPVDLLRLRRSYGKRSTDAGYLPEADGNLDARVTAMDVAYAYRNLGDATSIKPLSLTASVTPTPVTLPDNSLATRNSAVSIVGAVRAGTAIDLDLDGDGVFAEGHAIADGSGAFALPIGLQEGVNTVSVRAKDSFGQVRLQTIKLTRDTQAPAIDYLDLASGSDSSPLGDLRTTFTTVSVVGRTEPDALVSLGEPSIVVTADLAGRFEIPAVALNDGPNTFVVRARDSLGNESSRTMEIARESVPSGTVSLSEGERFSTVSPPISQTVRLKQGSRNIKLGIDAHFDTTDKSAAVEDTFLIYLVDPTNPRTTLLDRGTPGTAIFSLSGEKAEFTPGLVHFDGRTVEIDVTSLAARETAQLVYQLLNHDSDTGTIIHVSPPVNTVDDGGQQGPVFDGKQSLLTAGTSVDYSSWGVNSLLVPVFQNVRFDATAGQYKAELSLRNDGSAVSRNAVVAFPGLPTGVTLKNQSGKDASGVPYLNFSTVNPSGGLESGAQSPAVEIEFENPNAIRFAIRPSVYSAGGNHSPNFPAIAPSSVMPGGVLSIPLQATDIDGDGLSYSLDFFNADATSVQLLPDGRVVMRPTPSDLGDHSIDVIVSDGKLAARQTIKISVVPDANTQTRVSGRILTATDPAQPLAGVPIEISIGTTILASGIVTDASGGFVIPFAVPNSQSDIHELTIRVLGQATPNLPVGVKYPFIAEKLHLLFEARDTIVGVDNVIDRPIYLPALNPGTPVISTPDPVQPVQVVERSLLPNEAPTQVMVTKGSILTENGSLFQGDLGITEVPRELTPAALPENLMPDIVVTIQPGEMRFSTPAPITFPNRSGWAPGTLMNLWSINPVTGLFDDVGDMKVSADGKRNETVSGGIRNSSWHFPAPNPPTPNPPGGNSGNQKKGPCACTSCPCEASMTTGSEVLLHSGTYREWHDLVPYQSLGENSGLRLTYDSMRASPQPVLHFDYPANALNIPQQLGLAAFVTIYDSRPGGGGGGGIESATELVSTPFHYWSVSNESTGDFGAAIQVDLTHQPSGNYYFQISSGFVRNDETAELVSGSTLLVESASFLHVNESRSPLGAGWSLAGIDHLVFSRDKSVAIVDGGGGQLLFRLANELSGRYKSPDGDFSELVRLEDGSFRRTMKDQTISVFGPDGRLASVSDRNGNVIRYQYNDIGIKKIIDPVGLETNFGYTQNRVTSITDPAGRVTRLDHDTAGNLIRITDPDGTYRTFGYDATHHLTSEIDKRSSLEKTEYDFAGRVSRIIRPDGTEMQLTPLQVKGLYPKDLTSSPVSPPNVTVVQSTVVQTSDSNGNVRNVTVDQVGQAVSSRDGSGQATSTRRNSENLITNVTNGRDQSTQFSHDSVGNVIRIRDPLGTSSVADSSVSVSSRKHGTSFEITSPLVTDINADGFDDYIRVERGVQINVALGGNAATSPQELTAVGGGYKILKLVAGDFAGDGTRSLVAFDDIQRIHVWRFEQGRLVEKFATFIGGGSNTTIDADDLNADGRDELLVFSRPAFGTSGALTYRVDSNNAVGDLFFIFSGAKLVDVVAGDFNRDGISDFAYATTSNELKVRLVNAWQTDFNTFVDAPTWSVTLDAAPVSVQTADLNGDGVLDFVVNSADGVSRAVFLDPNGQLLGIVKVNGISAPAVLDPNQPAVLVTTQVGNASVYRVQPGSGATLVTRKDWGLGPTSSTSIVAGNILGVGTTVVVGGTGWQNLGDYGYEVYRVAAAESSGSGHRDFTHDAKFNQLTSVIDELGRETRFEVDSANGNRLSARRVFGKLDDSTNGETDDIVTRYTYTTRGQLDAITDPLGHVTDYDYDTLGRLIQVTYAKGTADEAVEHYEHDPNTVAGKAGLVTAFIDGNGHRTEYQYDSMNRMTRTIEPDPDGVTGPLTSPVSSFRYDPNGNLIQSVDAEGSVTRNEYDAMQRLIRRFDADPDGAAGPLESPLTKFTYDSNGNLLTVVDALGHVTEHVYDARNRRIRTVDPDGGVTSFGYDLDNNLTRVTDPVGNRTNFVYDQRNRLLLEIDPLGKTNKYSYDPVDNLIQKTDRNGRKTTYSYDAVDRLTTETWVAASGNDNVIEYKYDKSSNLLSVFDKQSSLVYSYDARNRVDTVDNRGSLATQGTPGAPRMVLDYGYDDVSNVVSLVDTINGTLGATTSYGYDGLDRQTRLTQVGTGLSDKRVDFAYNSLGQYDSIRRYKDLAASQLVASTSYSYDSLHRLDVMRHQNATGFTLNFHDLDYDSASRISRISDIDGIHDYSYDDRDQLTGAKHTAPGGGEITDLPDESYQYDANGNRLDSHLHGTGYKTGPGNRLLSDGTYNYEYDGEGNTVKRTRITGTESDGSSIREFKWDYRNRLVAVTDKKSDGTATQVVRFTYDGIDRRISKAVDITPADAVDAAMLYFINDREDVILDYLDADGAGPGAAVFSERYLHGPGIDQVLGQDDAAGVVHWHLTDHLGTVKDLTDNTGGVATHITYDSYGRIDEQPSPKLEPRYGFTGREYDGEVGLVYLRARLYAANVGRFVSEDKLSKEFADVNQYRYVQNSPKSYRDLTGFDKEAYFESDSLAKDVISIIEKRYIKGKAPSDIMSDLLTQVGDRNIRKLLNIPKSTPLTKPLEKYIQKVIEDPKFIRRPANEQLKTVCDTGFTGQDFINVFRDLEYLGLTNVAVWIKTILLG